MAHPPAISHTNFSRVHTATALGELVFQGSDPSAFHQLLESTGFHAARHAAFSAIRLETGDVELISHQLEFEFSPHLRQVRAVCHVSVCGDAAGAALAGTNAALLCLHSACRATGSTAALRNIHLQKDLQQTSARVIAISGIKNSGKSTLITSLLPHLQKAGCSTAVIKHDGHSFEADPIDTDTGKFMAAGAVGAAIFDTEKYKSIHLRTVREEDLISLFPEADLILLEGFKHSHWPKLEVVRSGVSSQPVCPPDKLLGIVTDLSLSIPIPILPLNDPSVVAQFLLCHCGRTHTAKQEAGSE